MDTPIHKLSSTLNGNAFYLKRDDFYPFCFGGNKARKASLFFEDVIKKRADCVVTYGSDCSNHCRIVANIVCKMGIPCYIISPDEIYRSTNNKKMIILFGAEIIHCPVTDVRNTIESKLTELKSKGYNPYFIPGGGHGNLGTQAYVYAYEEIKHYEKKENIFFDYVFHASGTGTTQAGLICGKIIQGDVNRRIIGISIARRNPKGIKTVLDSVTSYLQSISSITTNVDEVEFIDDFVLNGYGSYNNEILKVLKRLLVEDGVPVDTIYTGKAYWGMEEFIKANYICNKNILFIHTGGTPLFFDNLNELVYIQDDHKLISS